MSPFKEVERMFDALFSREWLRPLRGERLRETALPRRKRSEGKATWPGRRQAFRPVSERLRALGAGRARFSTAC